MSQQESLDLRNVLFPTDFSESSSAALHEAVEWARRSGGSLTILHAIDPPLPVGSESAFGDVEAAALRQLEECASSVAEPRPPIETHCACSGTAAEAILRQADASGAGLIVMSSHGRRGFRRWVVGSVTEEVLRGASCPVLVLHRDPDLDVAPPQSRMLVAVDFSPVSRDLIELAAAVASMEGAQLDIVHVVPMPVYPGVYGAAEFPVAALDVPGIEGRSKAELTRLVADVVGSRGPEVETFVLNGDPAQVIASHAEERRCGRIVVGTQGLSGFVRVILGSVAERVLRRASVPVLVAPVAGLEHDRDDD